MERRRIVPIVQGNCAEVALEIWEDSAEYAKQRERAAGFHRLMFSIIVHQPRKTAHRRLHDASRPRGSALCIVNWPRRATRRTEEQRRVCARAEISKRARDLIARPYGIPLAGDPRSATRESRRHKQRNFNHAAVRVGLFNFHKSFPAERGCTFLTFP